MDELSDETLCDRIGSGDRRAVAILYQRHVGNILRYLRLLGCPHDWVEDASHDVFLKVWTALERGQRPDRFRVWLTRIAHNAFVDYVRGPQRAREILVDPPDIPDRADDWDTPLVVGDALAKLDGSLREILVLHFYEGFTLQEIAELLETPLGTVKSRLARAYRHIAVSIRDHPTGTRLRPASRRAEPLWKEGREGV